MHCILDNHGIYLYKTSLEPMTDHHWKLYVNMLEIQKPVLLQFHLLAGVVINTSLKMVRKGIENVAEIRGYIKTCCKLDECQKQICVVYGKKQVIFHSL